VPLVAPQHSPSPQPTVHPAAQVPAPKAVEQPASPPSTMPPVARASHESPRLASYVPGLVAVGIACPYAAGAEIALDAEGVPHVLVRMSTGGVDAALGALMTTSAWLTSHAALVRSVVPSMRGTQAPRLHLFTDAPRDVRRLLETDIRVHVLASVSVVVDAAWYHAELN
jgi:hypothetical protein